MTDQTIGTNFLFDYRVREDQGIHQYYQQMRQHVYRLVVAVGIVGLIALFVAYQFPLGDIFTSGSLSSWWEANSQYISIFVPILIVVIAMTIWSLNMISRAGETNPWLVIDTNASRIEANDQQIKMTDQLSMEVIKNGSVPQYIRLFNNNHNIVVGQLAGSEDRYIPSKVIEKVVEQLRTKFSISTI